MRKVNGVVRAALIALGATAFACSLQTTGLGPSDGTESTASPGSAPSGSDTRTGMPTTTDEGPDGSIASDATTAVDGPEPLPEPEPDPIEPDAHVLSPDASNGSGDNADACDLDQDGHRANRPACGGDDCCDYDSRARPGQTGYFSEANACGSFDFDCDGKTTERFPLVACKLGLFACSGDGFAKPTACGVTSDYVTCGWAVLRCSQSAKPRPQACR